ncbi:MAG: right-handed parallel beta-helix repeat-containing protein [Planctomyces sp.]|nr:right-handed parallel beta-helix repeat-containing protein [Planctomyces sp.]
MKIVRNPRRWLSRLAKFSVTTAMLAAALPAGAQDGPGMFSRTPLFSTPSGSASEVVDSNRRGFGMSFRGGHIAGDTVGRSDSVTHIGLTPYINIEDGLLFGDSRLMRGNDGGLVWSFGGGYRHFIADLDVVAGVNSYFDNDDLTGADLQQWSIGAELLAQRWEARGNIYNSIGDVSAQVGSRVDQGSVAFVGQNIQYSRIDSFAEGLEGFDSEIGFLLPGEISERFDIRAFGGGYFYEGDNIDGFGGWSTRLQTDIGSWLELGLKLTDDEVFNTTVSFSAAVHFGGFKSQEHTKRSAIQRFREPVRRNMNVVTAETDVVTPGQIATNPLNGLAFTVAHVNSNDGIGPFNGTVEDPYQSLSTGLASGSDIVFVHAGSTFNAVPDNIVNLAAGRQLLGEGLISATTGDRIVQNQITLGGVGNLTLPSSPTFLASGQTLARPTLLNSVGNAVTMGSNSQLSGFIIDTPTGHGVFSNGSSNTKINDTEIRNAGGSGIELTNTTGTTTIFNTIIRNAVGPGLHVSGGTGEIGFRSGSTTEDPSWGAIFNTSQEAVLIENMSGGFVNMTGSTINDTGGEGILIQNNTSNVTIDNANVTNSTSSGIAIVNSDGTYTFRDTIRGGTIIDNAAQDSILVDSLAATGRVTFENVNITNRQSAGIEVTNSAGAVSFGQPVTIGTPAGGTAPAVSVNGSAATGSVTFARSLGITGSGGRGIELTGNATGSTFTTTGAVGISSTAGESIAIIGDNGTTAFNGGATINLRTLEGISIQNSDGSIAFRGTTLVTNANASNSSGVDIQSSEASVFFASLGVTNATGNPAVNLVNNIAGANGSALITFADLTITSTGGEGLFGLNNTNIRVNDGTINSTGAAAVNLEETGIQVALERVDSIGSPDFGIRLVETNKGIFNQFSVTGDTSVAGLGSGGTIQTAAAAGVLMQNAGQVRLQRMILDDNQFGVVVQNSGLDDEDDQYLQFYNSRISRSNVRGIDSLNLIHLDIQDSQFDDNGDDAALGRETILAQYDELLNDDDTTEFSEFDNPYLVTMLRSTIIDNSTDAVLIQSLAAANGAHLGVDFDRNNFTVTDTTDPTGNGTRDDAVVLRWNGPAFTNFSTNTILLSGAEAQTAFDLQSLSTTDVYELDLLSNQVNSTVTGTVAGQQIGLTLRTFGPSFSDIDNNAFTFTGGEGRGMEFSLAAEAVAVITDNSIIDNTDGGAGMIFTTVSQPSSFTIAGNTIGLFDAGTGIEEGILFNSVAGTVNLFGNQNNIVALLNPNTPNAFIETIFTMPGGTANGTIIVNGVRVP